MDALVAFFDPANIANLLASVVSALALVEWLRQEPQKKAQ